jgi:hypothetical protein
MVTLKMLSIQDLQCPDYPTATGAGGYVTVRGWLRPHIFATLTSMPVSLQAFIAVLPWLPKLSMFLLG